MSKMNGFQSRGFSIIPSNFQHTLADSFYSSKTHQRGATSQNEVPSAVYRVKHINKDLEQEFSD